MTTDGRADFRDRRGSSVRGFLADIFGLEYLARPEVRAKLDRSASEARPERQFCTAVRSSDGAKCQLEQHIGIEGRGVNHAAYVNGWIVQWGDSDGSWKNKNLATGDKLRDAPEQLRRFYGEVR